ncbi:hypothetical protein PT2222_390067 [Paraburkholderia tropica]
MNAPVVPLKNLGTLSEQAAPPLIGAIERTVGDVSVPEIRGGIGSSGRSLRGKTGVTRPGKCRRLWILAVSGDLKYGKRKQGKEAHRDAVFG